ncbi:MAG: hypothetical protein J6Z79_00240 [Clostridia bacterium]|nr:hypothetical protein [Clostridia bacterium]
MKKTKILSGVISLILAVSMIAALVPAAVEAKSPFGDPDLYKFLHDIKYQSKIYHSPEEKIATMTKAVENDRYALYIQEYTAEVVVVDKVTGQKLFTNPWDAADSECSISLQDQLLSQIILDYTDREGSNYKLTSYRDAAEQQQIVVKQIRNGVRVEYTLGAAAKKRIVPRRIERSRFEELILKPFFEATTESEVPFEDYIALKNGSDDDKMKAESMEAFAFSKVVSFYSLRDLSDPNLTAREQAAMVENYPVTEKMAIYVTDDKIKPADLNTIEGYIKEYTEYSLDDMLSDHEMTEYELEETSPPVFRMALEYTLEKDGFQARLPARGISYDSSTYTLGTIQVLPFLGAGRVSRKELVTVGGENAPADTDIRRDVGYNFVPDGSGTIINFDQNTQKTLISGTVYGPDYGFYDIGSAGAASYQTWRVPVYGTVMEETYVVAEDVYDRNDETLLLTAAGEYTMKQGFVAFMTEGESLTRIDAAFGGPEHEYNATTTTFFARQTDSYPLDGITVSGGEGTASYTKAIERKYVGNYTMKYRFLWDEEANYVGMANAYRRYLIDEGILPKEIDSKSDVSLYLDLLGDIDTTIQVLGVPVSTKAELTTFENAQTIMDELKDAGVKNQILRYLGWMNGGMASTAPAKMDVEGSLGGEKGLEKLVESVRSAGNQIFMDFDFAYVDTVGMFDGFDDKTDTAKTIDGKAAFFKDYNPVMHAFNTQVAYVVASNRVLPIYSKVAEKYGKLFKDGEKFISVGSLGSALSSSQDEEFPMNREDSKSYTISALERIAEDYDHVIVEDGNAYTWRYADHILDLPLDSSNRTNTTAEVPFLGILLHGYKHYTGAAINLAGDYEYNILKTIESGADPYFVIAYQNTALLKTNGYGAYYAVNYETWKENIISEYKRIDEAMKGVQGQSIISHEILDSRVVKVTYENGCVIYLNYNNFDVVEEGVPLSAMDFVVTGVR